jgi:hypothetical protein
MVAVSLGTGVPLHLGIPGIGRTSFRKVDAAFSGTLEINAGDFECLVGDVIGGLTEAQ